MNLDFTTCMILLIALNLLGFLSYLISVVQIVRPGAAMPAAARGTDDLEELLQQVDRAEADAHGDGGALPRPAESCHEQPPRHAPRSARTRGIAGISRLARNLTHLRAAAPDRQRRGGLA